MFGTTTHPLGPLLCPGKVGGAVDPKSGKVAGTTEVSTGTTQSGYLGHKAKLSPAPFPPKLALVPIEKEIAITIKIAIHKDCNCFHIGHDANNVSLLRHRRS